MGIFFFFLGGGGGGLLKNSSILGVCLIFLNYFFLGGGGQKVNALSKATFKKKNESTPGPCLLLY